MISSASGVFNGVGGYQVSGVRAPMVAPVSAGLTVAPVTAGVVAPPMMRSASFNSFSMAAPIVSAPVAMPAYNGQPVLTGNVGEARPISREELRESGRLTEAPPVDTGYAGVGPALSAYPAT